MKKLLLLITPILFFLTMVSCDQNRIFEAHTDLKQYRWYYADTIEYDVTIEDTSPKNVYLTIRHNFYFEWRNIWAKMYISTPNGTMIETPVEVTLSEPDGMWFSECAGDICDYLSPIPEFTNYTFEDTGTYHFKIVQDMRQDPLLNIMSVGLRIENVATE